MLSEVQQPVNDERSTLIGQVSEQIIEAHMTTCNYTSEKVAEGLREFETLKSKGHVVCTSGQTLNSTCT